MDLLRKETNVSAFLLVIAIMTIFFVFLTNYPVSNEPALACLFGLIAMILFFLAYKERERRSRNIYGVFAWMYLLVTLSFIAPYYAASSIVSILGIAIIGFLSTRFNRLGLYAFLVIAITVTAIISFAVLPSSLNYLWGKGSDEAVYEYYGSALLLNGTNPYTANIAPSLSRYDTAPTLLKNGTVESNYNYPALSLIPGAIAISLHEANTFYLFIFFLVLINVIAAFCVYHKSGFNNSLLLPLAAWIFATYVFVEAITAYLAILFLIFAYLFRKSTSVYAISLGLAVSTQQLAWIALPFFLILTLKERGSRKFAQVLIILIAVFLLINGYFIIGSPTYFFKDTVATYIDSGLAALGPNIFAIAQASDLPFISIVGIAVLVITVVLFYLYTERLRLLIGIGPAFLFFLEPRNLPMYVMAFVPLILLLYYQTLPKSIRIRRILTSRRRKSR